MLTKSLPTGNSTVYNVIVAVFEIRAVAYVVNENVTENRINNPTSDKTEQMS